MTILKFQLSDSRFHPSALILCLAALLCLIFCAPAFCTDAHVRPGKSAITIPFELDDNLIYVRVSVNGSRPLLFILDTGPHSIIHAKHARSIGLKLKKIGQAGGIGAK